MSERDYDRPRSIPAAEIAREERYARELIETTIDGAGADQENAIKLLHALAIPVPKKETWEKYDDAQREESMGAMIALYQRAVAP